MKVGQTGNNPVQSSEASASKRTDRAAQTKPAVKTAAEKAAARASGDAKTEISPKAKEMATAKAAATSAPDVREEKIAELRRRIAEGKYKVDPQAVADRMVDDHLAVGGA